VYRVYLLSIKVWIFSCPFYINLTKLCLSLIGATEVVFSDYNAEVIELATGPNVAKNVLPEYYHCAKLYSGDWEYMSQYMRDIEHMPDAVTKYDLILTAETLYTEKVCIELYQVQECLSSCV